MFDNLYSSDNPLLGWPPGPLRLTRAARASPGLDTGLCSFLFLFNSPLQPCRFILFHVSSVMCTISEALYMLIGSLRDCTLYTTDETMKSLKR